MKEINGVKLYTIDDLSELLGVSKQSVLLYIRKGYMRKTKISYQNYVSEQNLLDYLNGRSYPQPRRRAEKPNE